MHRYATRTPCRSIVAAIRRMLPLCDLFCLLCDFAWLVLAASLATSIYVRWLAPAGVGAGFADDIEPAVLVAAALAPFLLYDRRFACMACDRDTPALVRSWSLRFALFVGVALALGAIGQVLGDVPHRWLALWLAMGLPLTALTRVLAARYVQLLQRQRMLTEVIAIVGSGAVASDLVRRLQQCPPEKVELLGVFDDPPPNAQQVAAPHRGSIARLVEIGQARRIDWILLALPPSEEPRLPSVVSRLKALSVPIALCPQRAEPASQIGGADHAGAVVHGGAIEHIGDALPVSLLVDLPLRPWAAAMKSVEDVVIGGVITLLLLPLMALIALAIRLDSPGPVIFRQRRHTLNNREFDVYKFRTMHWNPSSSGCTRQTEPQDARVTRLGRLLRASSLDELPQLFNVLKGDMSLVGPRPHAIDMRTEDRLGPEISAQYPHRHRVRPGITGWSQVNGARGATSTSAQLRHRVELDLQYIDQWSLLLDLKILARTPREVLKGTNAF